MHIHLQTTTLFEHLPTACFNHEKKRDFKHGKNCMFYLVLLYFRKN